MVPPKRYGVSLVVCLLLAGYAAAAARYEGEGGEDGATQVIQHLNDSLLATMRRADQLGYQGRYELMAPVIEDCFDLTFMARMAIGRYWTKLSDADKRRWVETLSSFTVSNFAARFDNYSGQSFAIVGRKSASHETIMILTQLILPNADDVEINYRMHEVDGKWRVVDIYAGGKVSKVALRRADYASVLKTGRIKQLLTIVSQKTLSRAKM